MTTQTADLSRTLPTNVVVVGAILVLGTAAALTYIFPDGLEEPTPPKECYAQDSRPHEKYSMFFGRIYFLAWSVGFYPQIYSNFMTKSVKGLSVYFQTLNLFCFSCYALFNVSFYYVNSVTFFF